MPDSIKNTVHQHKDGLYLVAFGENVCFKFDFKREFEKDSEALSVSGKLLHRVGGAKENTRSLHYFNLVLGDSKQDLFRGPKMLG